MLNHTDDFYICPDVLGLNGTGLLVSGGDSYTKLSRRPTQTWFLRSRFQQDDDDMNVNLAFHLENLDSSFEPCDRFSKSILGLPKGTRPPWHMLMPSKEYKKYVSSVTQRVQSGLKTGAHNYYTETWSPCTTLFRSIQKFVSPNPVLFDHDCSEVPSFKPRSGFCESISYNRFGTRTGRLTVSSGPQILTLRKDLRKFLRSRWGDNGVLLSMDFSALEVRLLMSEHSGVVSQGDPYLDLSGALDGELNRERSKLALISTVYGSTVQGLMKSLVVSHHDAQKIHDTITTRYGVNDLVKRLRKEHSEKQFIRNRYLRRVETPEPGDGQLLNSYLQSTGVDVALLGFLEITKRLNSDWAVPVAVLHDALIVDATKEFADKIGDTLNIPVPGFEGKFPIKISVFNS